MKFMNVGKQGRIQDFKLGGANLKKIVPSGGRREMFLGISCEKSHQVCSPPGKTFHEEHIWKGKEWSQSYFLSQIQKHNFIRPLVHSWSDLKIICL
jgi:hypothetical protein